MSWSAASMSLLALVSVGLWTLRVTIAARGQRMVAAAVAAVEAIVFALVFSNLVADLGSWDRVAGYGAGVAAGTIVGLAMNDRFNPGATIIEAVVAGDGAELRRSLHARGWPATSMPASGVSGAATVLFLAVPTKSAGEVLDVIRSVAPDAFWTTRPATSLHQPVTAPATVPATA
jgi:uncharacterized protein YebE (UPF0316 family)